MNKLLLDESPLVIQKGLAKEIGLNKAIVVQQLHYLIKRRREDDRDRYFHDDRWWVYNSYQKWQDEFFSFWSVRTVRRIFKSLEEDGVFIVDNFNQESYDKTKWYSIDYQRLEELLNGEEEKKREREEEEQGTGQSDQRPTGQNDQRGCGQSGHKPMDKLTRGYGQSGQTNTKEVTKKSYKEDHEEDICAGEISNRNKDPVIEIYQKVFGRTLSSYQVELLNSYLEDGLTDQIIIMAIKEAGRRDVSGFGWLRETLNDWVSKRIDEPWKVRKYLEKRSGKEKGDSDGLFSNDSPKGTKREAKFRAKRI